MLEMALGGPRLPAPRPNVFNDFFLFNQPGTRPTGRSAPKDRSGEGGSFGFLGLCQDWSPPDNYRLRYSFAPMGALPLVSPIGLSDNTMGVQLAPVDPALGIELALGMLHNGFECAVGGPASEPVVYRSSNCRTVQGRLAKELLAALA